MAIRPVFISNLSKKGYVDTVDVEFKWFSGFSKVQKQKSIESLHNSFLNTYNNEKILEISSKSSDPLGISLSAFNLMLNLDSDNTHSVESVFQSSKVFENGGPYCDLLNKSSKEAKTDPRLKTSGKLLYFQHKDIKWPLEPKTLFYDWLYLNALSNNLTLISDVIKYTAFTDIEFNPQKSINCQARSVALFISLYKLNLLDFALTSKENFINTL
ncbi:DUF6977 family protein [Clostridium saccharoperbutylacetonicum]|uniref:DarT1-associated NADAR antitoxin family protein n=1 Tax=Clostridium saccharoperbutylacetonicum TaxID=36745 RepID=UPI0039EBDE4A